MKSLDRKLERPETFVSNVRTKPMQQKIKLEEVFWFELIQARVLYETGRAARGRICARMLRMREGASEKE